MTTPFFETAITASSVPVTANYVVQFVPPEPAARLILTQKDSARQWRACAARLSCRPTNVVVYVEPRGGRMFTAMTRDEAVLYCLFMATMPNGR